MSELAADSDDREQEPGGEDGSILEMLLTVGVALVLAWLVQGWLVKPFRIPSGSMENTLRCGDRVLVNRLAYRLGARPQRGDVLVFHPPAAVVDGRADTSVVAGPGTGAPRSSSGTRTVTAADVNYIKRVVGMPGDRVEVKSNHAWIDGRRLREPYLHPIPRGLGMTSSSEWGPYTVPKGTYLMLGDHRTNSADGRSFGFVPRSFIVGSAFLVYWPPGRLGALPSSDPGGTSDSKPDSNCLEAPEGQDH